MNPPVILDNEMVLINQKILSIGQYVPDKPQSSQQIIVDNESVYATGYTDWWHLIKW